MPKAYRNSTGRCGDEAAEKSTAGPSTPVAAATSAQDDSFLDWIRLQYEVESANFAWQNAAASR
jgi:hypothetical protein